MTTRLRLLLISLAVTSAGTITGAQSQPAAQLAIDAETLAHFQALLKRDTQSPPGNEIRAVEYLKEVLDKEGIPYQRFIRQTLEEAIDARRKKAS